MYDEKFWIAISFVIIIALLAKKISGVAASAMDQQSADIEKQLKQASAIKRDAHDVKEVYLQKKEEDEKQAEKIISNAKNTAENIKSDIDRSSKEAIAVKLAQVERMINVMEEEAIKEIRWAAVEVAMDKFKDYLRDNPQDDILYKSSIKNLKEAV